MPVVNGVGWFLVFLALMLAERLPAQVHGVLREYYPSITGTNVSDLTNNPSFPWHPATVGILTDFEAPSDVADDYGQRLTAVLTAPATGNYIFWIASDNGSELYIGTNALPAGKRLIASVPDHTGSREWSKYPSQQSAAIPLVVGGRYYLEALMKEGWSLDNLAVQWQLPSGTVETPIPNARLEVFQSPGADEFTMRHSGKALVRVTANDVGYLGGTVEIVTPPGFGTATAKPDGSVLYQHTTGQPDSDSFTYRLPGLGVGASNATVVIHFAADARFASDFVNFPAQPPPTPWRLADAFPNVRFNAPTDFCPVPGDPKQLLLLEISGRVWLIPDITAAQPTKQLVLNLHDRMATDLYELGSKGIACHPGFSTNGYLYVTYDTTNHVRLSRFTCTSHEPFTIDPNSELRLIDQVDVSPAGRYHDFNTCRFGPDGYLYVAIGDEGGQNEENDTAQRIDEQLYSCIIRIDVDKRPGNLEPNPDDEIPRDAHGKAYYSVPANNPFVGARTFNGRRLNSANVRTEMYVVGLRNPFQFSFDPGTDKLWVGDVQRDACEEVDLFSPGGNGGWPWLEANLPGPRAGETINGAKQSDATLTAPVLAYTHGTGLMQGNSVMGGLVYTGTNYPGLQGRYIFADYTAGRIWSFDPASPSNTFTWIGDGSRVVAIHPDPVTDDLLVLEWAPDGNDAARIRRLVADNSTAAFPANLSDTGFFADLTDLTPNPGAESYEPNLSFWSDNASKTRWFLLKDATNTVGWACEGGWSLPTGMIWAKHFDLELDRGNPATRKRIETRFLVKTPDGAYGVSYRWNDAGTDAALAPDSGAEFNLSVTNAGVKQVQRYHIPSRTECVACHTSAGGTALSFNSRQMNRAGIIAGVAGNQLTRLQDAGYLTGLTDDPLVLPRHVRADETQYSLEARVRSYLAVNCAICHQPSGNAPQSWDGRPDITLWQTHLINGTLLAGSTTPLDRLVVPGNLSQSVVWDRVARTNSYSTMPPLATNVRDDQAVQLLADWIMNSLPTQLDYDAWRLLHFGSLTSVAGEPGADPDGDGDVNEVEFLNHTDPNNPADAWRLEIVRLGDACNLLAPMPAGRCGRVESSVDLGLSDPWKPWPVPGNDGVPRAAAWTNSISLPPGSPTRFFRLRLQED